MFRQVSIKGIAPALIALLVFMVYAATAYPTVSGGGDSAELITAAYTMGIAHPPGYPLLMLLGKLFSFLPVGSIAFRINLLSGACGALAVYFLFLAILKLTRCNMIAALLGAGLFAFNQAVWHDATVAEVFALNNCFAALLLYLAILYSQQPRRNTAYWAAFVAGLSLTNQQTIIFFILPISVWFVWMNRHNPRHARIILKCFLLFLAGLLPYIYLPIAASSHPALNWGQTNTILGFFRHVIRAEYGTFNLNSDRAADLKSTLSNLGTFIHELAVVTLWCGLPLAALGFGVTTRRHAPSPGRLIAFCFLFYILVFCYMAATPLESQTSVLIFKRFWQLAFIPVFLWIGVGFSALQDSLHLQPLTSVSIMAALIGTQFVCNWERCDQYNNYAFRDMALTYLESAEPNALILDIDPMLSDSVRYLILAEGYRSDVKAIPIYKVTWGWFKPWAAVRYPDLTIPSGALDLHDWKHPGIYSLTELVRANYHKFPIYLDHPYRGAAGEDLAKSFGLYPFGYLKRVMTHDDFSRADKQDWLKRGQLLLTRFNFENLKYSSPSQEEALENNYRIFVDEWLQFKNEK